MSCPSPVASATTVDPAGSTATEHSREAPPRLAAAMRATPAAEPLACDAATDDWTLMFDAVHARLETCLQPGMGADAPPPQVVADCLHALRRLQALRAAERADPDARAGLAGRDGG